MFAQPIFMLRVKSINFYQNSPEIELFQRKNAKYSSAGGSAPTPPCLRRLCPQTPKTAPHCEFLATRLISPQLFFWYWFRNIFDRAVGRRTRNLDKMLGEVNLDNFINKETPNRMKAASKIC